MYGFANRKSARHTRSGLPVAVKGHNGTLLFASADAAERAMQDYARKVRTPETEFVVGRIFKATRPGQTPSNDQTITVA